MAELLTADIRIEANTALLEVDKGLKSPRVGEQCEAIVRVPSLMDRFPFPVLINAVFLKITDVFRSGSNLLRLNVLKVVQLTSNHLSKIINTEEFFRRMFSVMHSNDPVARAITLRMFAATANLISEKKTVHHSIRRSLESNDQVEVEAAIFASDAFSQRSGVFAAGICEKIATMVKGLKTPPEMKLKCIPLLRRMHHNLKTASQVWEVCQDLLLSHPALSFVTVVLHTLTELSVATLVQAPDQIRLLLRYAQCDARMLVRCHALKGLGRLASEVPQSWTEDMISCLVHLVGCAEYAREKALGLKALCILSSSSLVTSQMASLKESLLPHCYCESLAVAAPAIGTLTNISLSSMELSGSTAQLQELVHLTTETLILMDHSGTNARYIHVLLEGLLKLSSQCSANQGTILSLTQLLPLLPSNCVPLLGRVVAKLGVGSAGLWKTTGEQLSQLLMACGCEQLGKLLLPVSIVLMETHLGPYSSQQYCEFVSRYQPQLLSSLWNLQDKRRFWLAYQMARKASILGFPDLAKTILTRLSELMTDLLYYQWLCTLEQFCRAQMLVARACSSSANISGLVSALQQASSLTYDCAMIVKGTGRSSAMYTQFLANVAAMLDSHAQLLSLCYCHCSFLPTSSNSSNLASMFKESVVQLHSVAGGFASLAASLFDADPWTLEYMNLLQQSCTLLSTIISSLFSPTKPLLSPVPAATPVFPLATPILESVKSFNLDFTLGRVCSSVLSRTQSISDGSELVSASGKLEMLMKSIISVIEVPVVLPLSFFTSFQSTSVQLAFSPPLPSPGQFVLVVLGTHLSLKVEGVIEHAGKKVHRSPVAVLVRMKPKVDKILDSSLKLPTLKRLEQTPKIEDDYFAAEFLTTLSLPGYYTITVETSLIDRTGQVWNTGPKTEMNVLVNTEDKLKQQQRDREREKDKETAKEAKFSGGTRW